MERESKNYIIESTSETKIRRNGNLYDRYSFQKILNLEKYLQVVVRSLVHYMWFKTQCRNLKGNRDYVLRVRVETFKVMIP